LVFEFPTVWANSRSPDLPVIYKAKLKAARLRTEGRFTAPDPWNDGRSAEWSIEGYVWVPAHWRGVPPRMLEKTAASYALRSEIDGVERFLPDSLGHLMRTSGVSLASLPRLLAEIGPQLSKVDFKPMLGLGWPERSYACAGSPTRWSRPSRTPPATPTTASCSGCWH
jgi:hypothetical protein